MCVQRAFLQEPRSHRYDSEFWGKVGGPRKPGRRCKNALVEEDAEPDDEQKRQYRVNNKQDLKRCCELVLGLDVVDLRIRFRKAGGTPEDLLKSSSAKSRLMRL